MKGKKSKKHIIEEEPRFIVLNDQCQTFIGFKDGYPQFSDDLDLARSLYNDEQVRTLRIYTGFKLEKEYI